jgi:YaiO family outer membrane protein
MPIDFQSPPTAQVQAASPASFDAQYEQARTLANAGQPGLALAAYNALLAQSPGNADVLLGRGIVHTRMEHWSEAEADLEAAAKASPAYADVWLALGNLHMRQGRPDAARLDLEKARALGANGAELDAAFAALQPQALPRAANPEAVLAAGYTWAASLSGSWTDAGSGPRWNEQTASVRHYMKGGSIGFETLRAHRFGQSGHAWALDAYAGLWTGAYANIRYQRAPAARLFPANSGRVELYQSLGSGWEASLADDVLGFDSRVNIHGVGLGKYVGNWYVQLRHQNIVSQGSHGNGQRLLARYYYAGDAASYLEATANSGRSDDPLSLSGGRARSGGGSVTWVRYWSDNWGSKVGASFSRGASGSVDASRERGLSVGLYRRW